MLKSKYFCYFRANSCISNQTIKHYMSPIMTKPTKWLVRPAKTQIGICPVWSESSLSAWRKLGSLATHWAHSKDSDQTRRMPRLIWVFAGSRGQFVGFVMRQLIYSHLQNRELTFCRNKYYWFGTDLQVTPLTPLKQRKNMFEGVIGKTGGSLKLHTCRQVIE